ncbi:MAG: uncharacterized protein A8A55_0236 [Amphiamblys sp. WSBS2006]|nr:MAG: uncharacterized protein A8A55_0236 [Amphiamblys sp. WSBS2006]
MKVSIVSREDYIGLMQDVSKDCFTYGKLRRKYMAIGKDTFDFLFIHAQGRLHFRRYKDLNNDVERREKVYDEFLVEIERKKREDVATKKAGGLGMNPCLFLRVLLGCFFRRNRWGSEGEIQETITRITHNTDWARRITTNVFFNMNVVHCILSDHMVHSRIFETERRDAGIEGERMLEGELNSMGIPFYTEQYLQRIGESKTPDVLLRSPIYVNGNAVNWIESKNLFGDCSVYSEHRRSQLVPYVDLFGSGMVIYWKGYIEDLPPIDGVLVAAEFPETISR